MKTRGIISMERQQRWTGVAMWSLRQLKGMVEQEARDILRFRSKLHGMALERGSVVSVMEEVCMEQIITELFLLESKRMIFSD